MPLTTKQALAASLKKLLAKRGLEKITVKDIVEDCGVNRQTFYYHFHDVYALIEWIFQDAADRLAGDGLNEQDWTAGLESLMAYLRQERALVLNVYHSVSHEAVVDYIKRVLRPYVRVVVTVQAECMEQLARRENVDFVTDMFTLAAAGVITEWLGHGMEMEDTDERLRKFRTAMSGSVHLMLRNLEEEWEQ